MGLSRPRGGGHVRTSASGAVASAGASLAAQHAVLLGTDPARIDLHAGATIGIPSEVFRREEEHLTRTGAVSRQAEIEERARPGSPPLLVRPTQAFVSAVGGSRRAHPELVGLYPLPATHTRPEPGAWADWTDDALQEDELERVVKGAKKKRRASTAKGKQRAKAVPGHEDGSGGDGLDDVPSRLSIRESKIFHQSLRQSRLVYLTALLAPFSICQRVQPSTGGARDLEAEHKIICPVPASLTGNIGLRQAKLSLNELGHADVLVGPHIFPRTGFFEVKPSADGEPAPAPLEPPLILVEFCEHSQMRYLLPLWAAAVECKPTKLDGMDDHEVVLTFAVPALGSVGRHDTMARQQAQRAGGDGAGSQSSIAVTTTGVKEWLATWRIRATGSLWAILNRSLARSLDGESVPSFGRQTLSQAIVDAFRRVPGAKPGADEENERHLDKLARDFAVILGPTPAQPARAFPVFSLTSEAEIPPGLKDEMDDPFRPRLVIHDQQPTLQGFEIDPKGDGWALKHVTR